MAEWLLACGVELLVANVHPGHGASIAVARHLGLVAGAAGANGEIRFTDRRKASA
jgi:hypothetical protein